MPITVSCPSCGSRFSLSDDLYRRRVAGSLVKVKCRTCSAEIAVDATESANAASNESPRKQVAPPRPKAITQMGLGTPPPPSGLTPTPAYGDDDLTLMRPTLPLNATITPLPIAAAAPVSVDPDSMWADEETIAINVKAKAPPKPEAAQATPVANATEEMEQLDAEEIPVSSSGAPSLNTLTLEAGGAHVPHGRPPADEFLVGFHATDGNEALTGPTIDVTGLDSEAETPLNASTLDVTNFASEIDPPSVDVPAEKQEFEYRPARNGTVPQFDMNAVSLPATSASAANANSSAVSTPVAPRKQATSTSSTASASSAASAVASSASSVASASASSAPFSESRARERKFVIPPQDPVLASAAPRRAQRSRAPLWIALMLAAGAVGAGFGYRERVRSASLAELPRPVPSPVVNTQAALPAEAVNAAASETTNAAAASAVATEAPVPPSAPPVAPSIPVAPVAQTVAVGTTRDIAPPPVAAVKSSAISAGTGTRGSNALEPAVEKPVVADKPVEAHNAPPPAAPDTEFDRDAARNALASAASQASACRKEGDPSGTANLTITFAPSGRVTSAQIQGPPFSGTATGGCIASTMRRASVPAFSGDYVTVSKTIVVQ